MKEMTKIDDLALLANENSVCKAYLEAFLSNGFLPNRVVLVKFISDPKKNLGVKSLLKKVIKKALRSPKTAATKLIGIFVNRSDSKPTFSPPQWLKELAAFCENKSLPFPQFNTSVEEILIENEIDYEILEARTISDTIVENYIRSSVSEKFILFSGGGILRSNVLDLSQRFIHIHPGVVPEVKGADCILWSLLVREKIGMSMFFMNAGIDTGDLVTACEYDLPSISLSEVSDGVVLSNDVVQYIDPIYRAETMIRKILETPDLSSWESERQAPKSGKVYYFMHDSLKRLLPRSI